ncbi:SAM-dependent methyltransferase [Lentzea albida]|uniref:SAM-dependent methyltransferase n=1 Tax=Lentzea albida TaxID=65499 RepID=UPI0015A6CAB7|nr:SAM-dependent methyltransferase [Lentzea albida]
MSDDLPAHPGFPGGAGRRGVVTSHPNDESFPLPGADLTRSSVARIYDHHLGGTNNREAGGQFAERVLRDHPVVRSVVCANRMFQRRGGALPRPVGHPPVHRHRVRHEPVIVDHANPLLEGNGEPGRHAAVHADMRDTERVWS